MTKLEKAVGTLTAAQALGLSGAPLVVMVGSVVGQRLAPHPGLATLPLATMVVGTALGSAPAALSMQRLGRRRGFATGALLGAVASCLGAAAILAGSFAGFAVATLLIGANLSFVQQYRFAAAELGGPQAAGRAVSWVLAGGIVAGLLGPEIGRRARDIAAAPDAGPFFVLAGVYVVLALTLLTGLERDEARPAAGRSNARDGHMRTAVLLRRPSFLLAVGAGVTAFAVMTLVMTATPLAMHGTGHDIDATALVIQAHVVAMYAPSVVSGALIARVGIPRLMAGGVVALTGCLALSAAGDGLGVWVGALVLLGLGWNMLFVAATVALAEAYPGPDRFHAQALNDGLVFTAQAVASLSAGLLLETGGWRAVSLVALVPLAAMAAVLAGRTLATSRTLGIGSD